MKKSSLYIGSALILGFVGIVIGTLYFNTAIRIMSGSLEVPDFPTLLQYIPIWWTPTLFAILIAMVYLGFHGKDLAERERKEAP